LAHRSVLSTSVLFLVGGVLLGGSVLGVVEVDPSSELVYWTTEVALFVVLFTDGMRIPARDLRSTWRVPVRLLAVGMPLTMVLIALAAHVVLGLGLVGSILLAGILAPTDPVLAEAIIGQETIPLPLRRSLNLESGLNDGLALPVVVLTLSVVVPQTESWTSVLVDLVVGVVVGVVVPLVVVGLLRVPHLATTERYDMVLPAAVGLLIFSIGSELGGNLFFAGFVGGVTFASLSPTQAEGFRSIGSTTTEMLKLAALFLVGALLRPSFFSSWTLSTAAFVVLVLAVARPLAVEACLLRSPAPWEDRAVIAWFGPKGFASVIFTLLVVRSGGDHVDEVVFAATAVVVTSIVLHSSTDVPVARWLAARRGPS